jgi:hypothetical protein
MGYNRTIKLTGDARDAAVEYSNLDTEMGDRIKAAGDAYENAMLKINEEYVRRKLPILLRIAVPNNLDANELPGKVIVLHTGDGDKAEAFIIEENVRKPVPEPEPSRPNVLLN